MNWKEKFLNDLFTEDPIWVKDIVGENGTYTFQVSEEEWDQSCYILSRRKITNKYIQNAVYKQKVKFREALDEDEIELICWNIIYETVYDFEGDDEEHLIRKIIFNLNRKVKDHVDAWIGTLRLQKHDEDDEYLTPEAMLSYNQGVINENGDEETLLNFIDETANITYFHTDYVPTREMKIIRDTIEKKLTDTQKEILEQRTYMSQSEVAKKKGCTQQNISKTEKVIKNKIEKELEKILNTSETHVEIKLELEEFLNKVETEKEVIDFIVKEIKEEKEYIESIIENLSTELRQYLIINFIRTYNDSLINTTKTRVLCRNIINQIYIYLNKLNKLINTKPIRLIANKSNNKNYKEWLKEWVDNRTYYYLREDKLLEKNIKPLKINGKIVKKTIYGDTYYLVHINRKQYEMDWVKKNRKYPSKSKEDKYKKITLNGVIYKK